MGIQTIEDLESCLDSDLAWRKKEISTLYFSICAAQHAYRDILCKAGFAMLYAHFEGYTKFACEKYFEFISIRNLNFEELADSFWAIVLGKRMEAAASEAGLVGVLECVHFIRNCDSIKISLPTKGVISTKSNLSSSRFENILMALNMDSNMYKSKFVFIDEVLLDNRNKIAHGNRRDIDMGDFLTAKAVVVELIETLSVHIYEDAGNGAYRR